LHCKAGAVIVDVEDGIYTGKLKEEHNHMPNEPGKKVVQCSINSVNKYQESSGGRKKGNGDPARQRESTNASDPNPHSSKEIIER
jgi:hypothetical protein